MEDLFSQHNILPASISQSTISYYYGRDGHSNPAIRVSDHARIDELSDSHPDRFTVPCRIHEDMTEDEARELARWILADGLPVRLQLQAHKFIWSPETRGV